MVRVCINVTSNADFPCAMIIFGPVAQAARGGNSTPGFDLIVGVAVLLLTWIGYFKNGSSKTISIWIAVGISLIGGVFLYSGMTALLR